MLSGCEALFRDSPVWLGVLDASLVCRDASAAWRKRLDFGPHQTMAIPAAELFEESGFVVDHIRDAARGGGTTEAVPVLLTTRGAPTPGVLSAWRIHDKSDAGSMMLAVVTGSAHADCPDEYDRLQTAHQLILDAAGEGIYGLDAEGRLTFGNAAAMRLLGWRMEDVLGKKGHDVHHHSHADGTPYPHEDCPIYAALSDGEIHQVDNEVFWHADGSAIPVQYTSTPIIRDGRPNGAVVVFCDIAARKELEEQRRQAYDELKQLQIAHQLILDTAGEGIYGLDNEGKITFSNAAADEIVGWRSEEVMGQCAHDVHHHSYPDGTPYPRKKCPIYAASKDGEVHHVDTEVFWRSDGSAVPVEYTSTPILKEGRPDGAVVIFRDISERKQIEQQRESAYREIRKLKDQLERERDYLRDEIEITSHFGEIIGESAALKRTLAQIEAVAKTPVSALILGESGVGKEMLARAIHTQSDRADNPLVKVNCASIPKDLFESEFFGHVRGAFTGAQQDRVGRLQLADGGTLFLDEIGEIPLSQQGKLLRALQEHEFERVGDDRTIKVDVRVVAATNRNLAEETQAGRFREDLYYRLSVFPIEMPPLRERVDDIVPLALHFLERIAIELGRDTPKLTRHQAETLRNYRWPGNIRELKNVMERAVISSARGRLQIEPLVPNTSTGNAREAESAPASSEILTDSEIRELEKANVIAALQSVDWQIWGASGAAELLGLKPSTLAYRMKTLGIDKKAP